MDGWCLIYTEVFMVQILPTIELKKKKKKKKGRKKEDLKLILRKSNNGVAMRR